MKAEELKINNWVFAKKGSKKVACQVKSMDWDFTDIRSVQLLIKDTEDWLTKNIDEIKPAPLSEKGLRTLGFQLGTGSYYRLGRMRIKWYDKVKSDMAIWIDEAMLPYSITRDIKYTHQLQNLYYGLTQGELMPVEIKTKDPDPVIPEQKYPKQEELNLPSAQTAQVEFSLGKLKQNK